MNKKILFCLFLVPAIGLFSGNKNSSSEVKGNKGIEFRHIAEAEVPFFIQDEIFTTIDTHVSFVINPTQGQKERREELQKQYKAPTGLSFLLYGPPGSGKTEMAKYIAYKNGYLFAMIKQDDFVSPYAGETEINLAKIIKQIVNISREQPVVLLFDEIDSFIFSREGFGLQQFKVDLVNAFLQHLEMLNRNPHVIIFGTTNRYQSLDKAAIRPGRFNYHYQVHYPSKQLILAYLDEKLPLQVFIDHNNKKKMLEKIIKENNFSYAHLGFLVNQMLESYIKTGKKIASNDSFPVKPTMSWMEYLRKLKERFLLSANSTDFGSIVLVGGTAAISGLFVWPYWLKLYHRN